MLLIDQSQRDVAETGRFSLAPLQWIACYTQIMYLPVAILKPLRAIVLVGVILVGILTVNVVLVVHLLGLLLRLALGLLAVEPVLALGLCKLVNL